MRLLAGGHALKALASIVPPPLVVKREEVDIILPVIEVKEVPKEPEIKVKVTVNPPKKKGLYDPGKVFNKRKRLLALLKRMKIYSKQLTSDELDLVGRAGSKVKMKDSEIRQVFLDIMRGRGVTK